MKKLSPGEKAWATRRANEQRKAQKRGGGKKRGHRGGTGKGGKKKFQVPASGFKKIKKGPRKGDVFPVLSPGQKAWRTRRAREGKKPTTLPLQSIYARQWEMPSRTQKGKFYKVSLRTDGVWMCSCPAWIFQGGPIADRSSCPHIREAQRIAGFKVKKNKKAYSFKDFEQQFNAYPWNMKSLKKLSHARTRELFKAYKESGRTFEAWAKRLNNQLMEEGRTTKQRLGISAPEGVSVKVDLRKSPLDWKVTFESPDQRPRFQTIKVKAYSEGEARTIVAKKIREAGMKGRVVSAKSSVDIPIHTIKKK